MKSRICLFTAPVLAACTFLQACGTQSADTSNATNPTPEERGLESLGLWNATVGGFRGFAPIDNHYRFWTGDNALVLWAMSKGRFAYGRQAGWGDAIRDYLMDEENEGLFTEGRKIHVSTGVIGDTNRNCSPFMETQVLWGILSYTSAWPNRAGRRPAERYDKFITRVLKRQHQRVMAREGGSPCATSGSQPQHNFTDGATIAFHIMNAAVWAKESNTPEFRRMAEDAWDLLKPRQAADGTFDGATLRNAQILHALTQTLQAGVNPAGLQAARNKLAQAAKKTQGPALHFGNQASAASTDTQAFAYHMLSVEERPFSATGFLHNRMCQSNGYVWKGRGDTDKPGPIEDQAMALLGSWKIHQKGWNENGAPCTL